MCQESGCGIAGWSWLTVFHEVDIKVSAGSVVVWMKGLLSSWFTWLLAGLCSSPMILIGAWESSGHISWLLPEQAMRERARERETIVFNNRISEVTHPHFHSWSHTDQDWQPGRGLCQCTNTRRWEPLGIIWEADWYTQQGVLQGQMLGYPSKVWRETSGRRKKKKEERGGENIIASHS